jgi:hypothetical protein
MFPSRPPEPLGPGIAPVIIYEESIEDPGFIIDCIKTAHKQRVAERRLNPRRKRVPKKKYRWAPGSAKSRERGCHGCGSR